MTKRIFVSLLLFASLLFGSEHGIYLKLIQNSSLNLDTITVKIKDNLERNGFKILKIHNVENPSIVEESEGCNYKIKLIIATSDNYIKLLSSFNNKYLVAGLLRIAIYENNNGVQVNILDPETINRIVFNDLYDNDNISEYNDVIAKTIIIKNKLVNAIHNSSVGEKVSIPQEPIRSSEDLAESSKDMFMMVGPLTLFTDEDQFPIIYERESQNKNDIHDFLKEISENLKNQKPSQDDIDYRLTKSDEVLKWNIISEVYSPDSTAILLGITRPRTEGLSFLIAGKARVSEENLCPGIDHAAAYPIEILVRIKEGKIVVQTAREMARMDMYFWDAGMMAFMDHMSMPDILDNSLRKAILGKFYEE